MMTVFEQVAGASFLSVLFSVIGTMAGMYFVFRRKLADARKREFEDELNKKRAEVQAELDERKAKAEIDYTIISNSLAIVQADATNLRKELTDVQSSFAERISAILQQHADCENRNDEYRRENRELDDRIRVLEAAAAAAAQTNKGTQ